MMGPFIIGVVIWILGYYLVAQWAKGGQCTSMARLDGKTVLITGANTGIGRETALDLASRGADVHILCRDQKKGKAAAEVIEKIVVKEVTVHSLDVSCLESVRECVKEITAKLSKIDILINNAGVMACPLTKTKDGFELQLATNHLGPFLLTLELLPLIRKGQNPRIVTVSSLAHKTGKIYFEDINFASIPYKPFKAYNQSKLANILFTRELGRRELDAGSGVTANCLHPGVVKTELSRYKHHTLSAGVFHYLTQVMMAPFFKTPESGAQTTIFCAVDEALEGVTGKYFADCKEVETAEVAKNMDDAARLWDESLKMVKKNH